MPLKVKIRAHVERCKHTLRVPVDRCECGGRDVELGGTGALPYGQADATDEGELRMAVAADRAQGIVRVMFGKPIAWLGLPSMQARDFGARLIALADELDKGKM